MALLHHAVLSPTKRELLDAWLPGRPWYDGTVERGPVGSFRFDDPAGEVGLEAFLLGSAFGSTLFVPLTYRSAPLPSGEPHLIGVTDHSVLGSRWVYDGCGDPAWAQALAAAIRTGGTQAEEFFEADGRREVREPSVQVRGSGTDPEARVPLPSSVECVDHDGITVMTAGLTRLLVTRRVGVALEAGVVLLATWDGGRDVALAGVVS